MQGRLHVFEQCITHLLGRSQTLDIIEAKLEMAKIKKMITELYDRLVIPKPVITKVVLEAHIEIFGLF